MQPQEELIREIVRRVVAQANGQQRDASGALLIHTAYVETEPFEGRSRL